MTQYFDKLDNGDLGVWTHDQDPDTDDPAQATSDWGEIWYEDDDGNVAEPPPEVYDLLETEWSKGVPDQARGLTAKAAQIQMDMIQQARGDAGRIQRR